METRRYDHRDCAALAVVLAGTREGYGEVKGGRTIARAASFTIAKIQYTALKQP
jgi:hypothetical protein